MNAAYVLLAVVAMLIVPDLADLAEAIRDRSRGGRHRAVTTHGHLHGVRLASRSLAYHLVHRPRPAHLR